MATTSSNALAVVICAIGVMVIVKVPLVAMVVRSVVSPPNPIERRMTRFLREPVSVRNAASVIVMTTLVVVIGAGVAIRILDHHEYSSIWLGMWLALQTVTTVGYGDVTREEPDRHARWCVV